MVWCTQESYVLGWDGMGWGISRRCLMKNFLRDPWEPAKGISKGVNKLILKHDMYKKCLMDVELRKDNIGTENC